MAQLTCKQKAQQLSKQGYKIQYHPWGYSCAHYSEWGFADKWILDTPGYDYRTAVITAYDIIFNGNK